MALDSAVKHKASQTANGTATEQPADRRLYFNRELSWLEFNARVLEEAMDESLPLLERLKFLAIFSTNLDEFFMIRVAGILEQIAEGVCELSPDGMTPQEQITEIFRRVRPMLDKQARCLAGNLLPALRKAGISIVPYASLAAKEKKKIDKYFHDDVFPILTPQSVDSSHPFPYISNLSLNLGTMVAPDRIALPPPLRHLFKQKRFGRIKLPPAVPRLIAVDHKEERYVLLEEIVAANLGELFPNMRTSDAFLFRVSRDADIELREDEAGDLMRSLERELQRRRDRFPVRLELSSAMPVKMHKMLVAGVGVREECVEPIDGFMNIPDLMQLYGLDRPALKEKPISPISLRTMDEKRSMFDLIRRGDILLHHPYHSFNIVIDLLTEAVEDPNVKAIKICLYRTGKDSPIIGSLIRAAQMGKQVTALVELKARFDEENNIEWAKRLEKEGVHVIYGISTLKTHSKVMLIVRREKQKLVRYVHIATGNYNLTTARTYTDLGLLTADEVIGADVTDLFNFLTGYSQQDKYRRLFVSPFHVRDRLITMIRREKKNKLAGRKASIVLKANSLTDDELINELYEASKAGVDIDLIIRGTCTLRPGVKGLSENIRVRSIVGRFLEHSRVFWFANDGVPDVLIGSADLMHRNMDRRVEVLTPIRDESLKTYLRDVLLENYLKDQVNARLLKSDGTYKRVASRASGGFDAQMAFVGKLIGS